MSDLDQANRKTIDWSVEGFVSALLLDDCVIGGGHARLLKGLRTGCRPGSNANAFVGGFRMGESAASRKAPASQQPPHAQA